MVLYYKPTTSKIPKQVSKSRGNIDFVILVTTSTHAHENIQLKPIFVSFHFITTLSSIINLENFQNILKTIRLKNEILPTRNLFCFNSI